MPASSTRHLAAFAVVLALMASGAWAQQGAPSLAVGVSARFRSQGIFTQMAPIATLTGAASDRYDSSETIGQISQSVQLAAKPPSAVFVVTATGLRSHVTAAPNGPGAREARGENTLSAASLILGSGAASRATAAGLAPALAIDARELVSSAFFNTTAGGRAVAVGLASVGALTISGPLVGGGRLRFSGSIAPNTVLYRSPTVTITLNRQVESGAPACDPDCDTDPMSAAVAVIQVVAIDIELHNANVGGAKVSGEIRVNQATAQ